MRVISTNSTEYVDLVMTRALDLGEIEGCREEVAEDDLLEVLALAATIREEEANHHQAMVVAMDIREQD